MPLWSKRVIYQVAALSLLALLGVALPVAAQGPQPGREETGGAPKREPVVVSTERLSPHAVRTVVIFAPTDDTYIASGRPNNPFGTALRLYMGYDLDSVSGKFEAQRPLLYFNIAAIPEGAIINSATLELHLAESSPSGDEPMGANVYRVTAPWSESSVTWNTRPAYSPEERGRTEVGSSPGAYRWDVTGLVEDWVSGRFPNHGMLLIGDERVQERERAFFSANVEGGNYPSLEIDYTLDTTAPQVTVNALPAYSPATFTVSWSGEDEGPAGIAYYDVQYQEDGGEWKTLIGQAPAGTTSTTFQGENGKTYRFEARGVDTAGNVEPFEDKAEAETTVDSAPPTVNVARLPATTRDNTFTVAWSGSDNAGGSGIDYYDVQYRFNNGPWTRWQTRTQATSAIFTATSGDGVYEFEARGVDRLGNVEPFADRREAAIALDAQQPFIEPHVRIVVILVNTTLSAK